MMDILHKLRDMAKNEVEIRYLEKKERKK